MRRKTSLFTFSLLAFLTILRKAYPLTVNHMLIEWDFSDEAANSTTQQINRQKSARNLGVREFDHSVPSAVFHDAGRKQTHRATLLTCDCRDFNFAGSSPRKSFRPCMHIYRLAIELGLIEAKHLNHPPWRVPRRLGFAARRPGTWRTWRIDFSSTAPRGSASPQSPEALTAERTGRGRNPPSGMTACISWP